MRVKQIQQNPTPTRRTQARQHHNGGRLRGVRHASPRHSRTHPRARTPRSRTHTAPRTTSPVDPTLPRRRPPEPPSVRDAQRNAFVAPNVIRSLPRHPECHAHFLVARVATKVPRSFSSTPPPLTAAFTTPSNPSLPTSRSHRTPPPTIVGAPRWPKANAWVAGRPQREARGRPPRLAAPRAGHPSKFPNSAKDSV